MSEILENSGIYFDDVNKIRILDPKVADETESLRLKCKDFVDKLEDFHQLTDNFVESMRALADEVNNEKLKAIGHMNLIHTLTKQGEVKRIQLQTSVHEKTIELERLRIENLSLQKTLAEQQDVLDQITQLI